MGIKAKDCAHGFGPSSAHQTCKADDLASARIKADIFENALLTEVLHFNCLFADCHVLPGIDVGNFASHHARDDCVQIQILRPVCGDNAAVAQDGDIVGNFKDLIHLVGDINDGDALCLQLPNLFKELCNFFFRDGGSGFVHNNDLCVICDRLDDFQHLNIGYRQGFQLLCGRIGKPLVF